MFVRLVVLVPQKHEDRVEVVHAQQVLAVIWQVVEDGLWNSPSLLFQVLASALSLWG